MITDRFMQVSLAQDISQIVGTYVSTDSIDLNPDAGIGANQAPDIGIGTKIRAAFTIVAAVVGTVSTVAFEIITAADALLTTTPVVIGTSIAIPEAELVAGAQIFVEMNPDVLDRQSGVQRFLGARYVVAVATTTAGTVTADFVIDLQDGHRHYRSGFTV